jgi:enoyl-CoA hydratase/carnithine racemase
MTNMADEVLYETQDGVAVLTLNRPHRANAWNQAMGDRFFELLAAATNDPAIKVIVVTGAGKAFCSGADMAVLESDGGGDAVMGEARRRQPALLLNVPKPVIAAINGGVAGGGFVVALACDLRFAATGAKITSAFSRRGLIAEYGSAWLLPRIVGTSRALDILLSGRILLAEEAFAIGLVDRLFAPEELLDGAVSYAREIATYCSPGSMATIKRQVLRSLGTTLEAALEEAHGLMTDSLQGDDFREGVASYLDRREPRFDPLVSLPGDRIVAGSEDP